MSFWGVEIKPKQVVPFVPPPEQARLHISQACLASLDYGDSALKVAVQDGPELFVCRLVADSHAYANLDLVLDEYTELTCEGAALHVTGYLMPEEPQGDDEEEDEEDEMDEDFTPEMADRLRGMITMDGDQDLEDEDSEASESDDDYDDGYIKGMGVDMGSDEEDGEDDDEDDESDDDEYTHPSNVVIEEIMDAQVEMPQSHEKEEAKPSKKRKADTPATVKSEPQSLEDLLASAKSPATAKPSAAKQKKTDQAATAAASAAVPVSAATKKQKTGTAAAATPAGDASEAGLSKSQLKKQRKQARANGEAPAANATATETPVQAQPVAADIAPKKGSVQKWENGFQIERLHVGKPDGKLAKPGKKVIVKYRGTLSNGKVFDETKGNKTFSFRLGVGEVIKGWDRGVAGMRVGDKRKLTVPPQMAYGTGGVKGAGIPPNATLTFSVELVDVK